jgi:tyrosine-protein kinase Etk/Wzc
MSYSDLRSYIDVLARWRRFIIGLTLGAAALSVVVAFVLPKSYTARSSILPPTSDDVGTNLGALVRGLTLPGLGNVAPTGAETQVTLAVLDSRRLREESIEAFDLRAVYKAKTMDEALRSHRANAQVGVTDEGIVEVLVTDRSPMRAAEIANAWIESLDRYNRETRLTSGRRSRQFVERRLEETRAALSAAEDSLAAYQRDNTAAPLSPDITASIESSASVLARRLAVSVRLSALEEVYRPEAPEVAQLRQELRALDSQIERIPPLAIESARRVRDVKVQEQLYLLLTAQYEDARLRELQDSPTIEVLDRAVPPERRSRPIRWLVCSSMTLAALVLAVGTAFLSEFLRRFRAGV